jgi:small subunit ribosomal protein S6
MSRKYECVLVLSPVLGEEGLTATLDKIKGLIESSATLIGVDEWGKRTLAYEIEDLKEGMYYLVNFEAEADFPAELERVLKITDGVLRFLVVRLDDQKKG